MKIAIRGGHNYAVPGATGILDEVKEDRKYYKAVMKYLRDAGHEVLDVTPDRTDTSSQDLSYGVSRANDWGADLFVSCHLNSGGGKGCEVLYYTGSEKGNRYASKVSDEIAELGFNNRGAKQDVRGLYELNHTQMPAIIIEPLFIDSKLDVKLYKKIGVDKLGKVIAEAINGEKIIPEYPGYLIMYDPRKKDKNVNLIKQRLMELGYKGMKINSKFGIGTKRAIKKFQKKNGLKTDGVVGKATWKALFK
ncbi:N-acetylmuramoyl-L-alanine amidase [Clostridium oryzae]|uniref:Sporulation-specific N-acetylmuramoyl-L-alanine amidase n=1 Tax=Clostridium oryzae TaxID=1450648 RepID=A0A1V4IMC0_9CLOT|nr:N-acetylmuramoyl-L-alanine amidase [Clostridium oryzae]OPJ61171.1 sporulation-specific N-acetylmuramoyl-L-alanine amidase [Clostridium oryzae]